MTCTRCQGTGFLNPELIPESLQGANIEDIAAWLTTDEGKKSGVSICDCCGDGTEWHGEPGQHYTSQAPPGKNGPYAYNGGLSECH